MPTGKVYVGQSRCSLNKRKREHFLAAKYGKDAKFYRAIRKYGEDAWIWDVLEEVPVEELSAKEVEWISVYNSFKNGYNSTSGGEANYERTPEQRRAISDRLKGKKRPPEVMEKVAAANRGKKRSPEAIEKSAAALRGKKRSPEAIAKTAAANRGKKRSKEVCAKMSESHKRKGGKGVRCIETQAEFPSVREASRAMKLNRAKITAVLENVVSDVEGFSFEYLAA